MRMVQVRTQTSSNNFYTDPFEVGCRHFKVAFCDGSQNTLLHLAKERMIYRPNEKDNTYQPLTIGRRIFHILVGTLQTVGYLTIVIPFIVLAIQKLWQPLYIKVRGGQPVRIHLEEGGNFPAIHADSDILRKNPFHPNGLEDPFYRGASWMTNNRQIFA